MKASELRIGNLVHYSDGQNTVDNFIDYADLEIIDHNLAGNFSPIPLTEEWLVKFGFEWQYNDIWLNDLGLSIEWNKEKKCCSYLFQPKIWKRWLFYVHELQNLHFALTGEELILKP